MDSEKIADALEEAAAEIIRGCGADYICQTQAIQGLPLKLATEFDMHIKCDIRLAGGNTAFPMIATGHDRADQYVKDWLATYVLFLAEYFRTDV